MKYLGFNRETGIDFIAKFNNRYVIAEAKFLTDFGGHQNAQFDDAVRTMQNSFEDKKVDNEIIPIAIMDGVLYIQGNNKMYRYLQEHPKQIILSSLLFKGDNFEALSVLLKKYKNKVDLVYIDPTFNTANDFYVSDTRANSISSNKKSILAYSDKMTKEEFLEFLRERLVLIKELLSDKGSIYLHIDYKIGQYVKIIMDEIFGEENFKNDITRIKSNPKNFYRRAYGNEKDMILFYSKNAKNNIWNDLRIPLDDDEINEKFKKIDKNGRRYTTIPLHAPGETKNGITGKPWRNIPVPEGRHLNKIFPISFNMPN